VHNPTSRWLAIPLAKEAPADSPAVPFELLSTRRLVDAGETFSDVPERMGRVKLLIVDDSVVVREILKDSLSEVKGIEIAGEAANASEAIEMIRRLKPDVVVLDFKMPGGNGLSVLKEIRNEQLSPLVLMFTNYPHLQYREACLNAGAHYFFDKSNDFDKVIELLEQTAQPPGGELTSS